MRCFQNALLGQKICPSRKRVVFRGAQPKKSKYFMEIDNMPPQQRGFCFVLTGNCCLKSRITTQPPQRRRFAFRSCSRIGMGNPSPTHLDELHPIQPNTQASNKSGRLIASPWTTVSAVQTFKQQLIRPWEWSQIPDSAGQSSTPYRFPPPVPPAILRTGKPERTRTGQV